MSDKVSKREKFLKWWRVEGKIECIGGIIAMTVMITFWENLLIQGIVMILGSFWALGKIYFRRDQKLFLILLAGLVFFQGLSHIFAHFKLP